MNTCKLKGLNVQHLVLIRTHPSIISSIITKVQAKFPLKD